MGRQVENLDGVEFHRLKVVSRDSTKNKGRGSWLCECECGTRVIVRSSHLKSGQTKSCGCLSREFTRKLNSTHGMSKTSEYKTWLGMKRRCYAVKDIAYANYGGRGITICEEWFHSFEQFYSDMGKKPSEGHSIDRIDGGGNYNKSNCRWADWFTQTANRRISTTSATGCAGVSMRSRGSKIKYEVNIGHYGAKYLGSFSSIFDAVEARNNYITSHKTEHKKQQLYTYYPWSLDHGQTPIFDGKHSI